MTPSEKASAALKSQVDSNQLSENQTDSENKLRPYNQAANTTNSLNYDNLASNAGIDLGLVATSTNAGIVEIDSKPRVKTPIESRREPPINAAIFYVLTTEDKYQFWLKIGNNADQFLYEINKDLSLEDPTFSPATVSVSGSGQLDVGESVSVTDSKPYFANVPILVFQTATDTMSTINGDIPTGSSTVGSVAGPLSEAEGSRTATQSSYLTLPPSPDFFGNFYTISVSGEATHSDADPGLLMGYSFFASATIVGPAPIEDLNYPDNIFDAWISTQGSKWHVTIRHLPNTDQSSGEYDLFQQIIYLQKGANPIIFERANGDTPVAADTDWRSGVLQYNKILDTSNSDCSTSYTATVDVNLKTSGSKYFCIDLEQDVDGETLKTRLESESAAIPATLATARYTEDGTCLLGDITESTVRIKGPARGDVQGIAWMG
jgi:hypothetical protein